MNRQVTYCGCGACEFTIIDGELKSAAGPVRATEYKEHHEVEYRCLYCGMDMLFSLRFGVVRTIEPSKGGVE